MNLPLLLLPGLLNDERVWSPVRDAAEDGRTVVVAPTHEAIGVEAIAASALARMPPGPLAVAGFSLGGYVALEVCRQAAGRLAGLALLDTGARAETAEGRALRLRLIAGATAPLAPGGFDALAAAYMPRIVHPGRAEDPVLRDLLIAMARVVTPEGFVRQQTTAMERPDSRDTLQSVTVPTLVACGRQDTVTPLALSEEMAGLAPNAELVVLEEAGHMAMLEQPQAAREAFAAWLARVG